MTTPRAAARSFHAEGGRHSRPGLKTTASLAVFGADGDGAHEAVSLLRAFPA